jgi:hypothetical protein
MRNKIILGCEAKDRITGFQGIITGHAKYLTGCDQYIIQPKCEDSNGKYPEANWFDEGRIELIGTGINSDEVKGEKNGCDYVAPIK